MEKLDSSPGLLGLRPLRLLPLINLNTPLPHPYMKKKLKLYRHYDIMEITHHLQSEGLLLNTIFSIEFFFFLCGSHLKNVEWKEFTTLIVNDSTGTSIWVLTPSSLYLPLHHVTSIRNNSDMVCGILCLQTPSTCILNSTGSRRKIPI